MAGSARQVTVDKIPAEYIPLEVGSVRVGVDGQVNVGPNSHASRFRFVFNDIRFSALACRREADGQLRLCGSLGVLPYSAESITTRRAALDAVREATAVHAGRFVVADDQNILLLANMVVPLPFTPSKLISHLTICLIQLKPHIAHIRGVLAERSAERAITHA